MTAENIAKAGDKYRTFIIHGAVAGIVAGCLLGYWFESPTLREEYSWSGFYGNFFEVIQRSSYEIEEKFEVIDVSETQPAAEQDALHGFPVPEIDTSDPETVIADGPETGDAAAEKVIMVEIKKKKVAAPLMPWLLSVVSFGLLGLILGALIPNKRRPAKRDSDEAKAA